MVFCQDKDDTNIFPSFTPAYWADTGGRPYEKSTTATFIISRSLSDLGTKVQAGEVFGNKKAGIHVWTSGFLNHFSPSAKNGGRYWTRTSDLLRVEQAL